MFYSCNHHNLCPDSNHKYREVPGRPFSWLVHYVSLSTFKSSSFYVTAMCNCYQHITGYSPIIHSFIYHRLFTVYWPFRRPLSHSLLLKWLVTVRIILIISIDIKTALVRPLANGKPVCVSGGCSDHQLQIFIQTALESTVLSRQWNIICTTILFLSRLPSTFLYTFLCWLSASFNKTCLLRFPSHV